MRGSKAKRLRREVYGERSTWDLEGYFPFHPRARSYVILKTYEKIVPRLTLAATDKDQSVSIQLQGADGRMYNYRYVPWKYNGELQADPERRQYQFLKGRRWQAALKAGVSTERYLREGVG